MKGWEPISSNCPTSRFSVSKTLKTPHFLLFLVRRFLYYGTTNIIFCFFVLLFLFLSPPPPLCTATLRSVPDIHRLCSLLGRRKSVCMSFVSRVMNKQVGPIAGTLTLSTLLLLPSSNIPSGLSAQFHFTSALLSSLPQQNKGNLNLFCAT